MTETRDGWKETTQALADCQAALSAMRERCEALEKMLSVCQKFICDELCAVELSPAKGDHFHECEDARALLTPDTEQK